jgi:PAS domain S-box-containing protein
VGEGAPYEVEYRAAAPAPDGGERWLLARGRVERDAAGRPLRGAGVLLDITARRRAEAALRESEARYRATQEHAGVGIGEADAQGRFLRANAALCAITGYPREELLGRTVFDVTHPEDAAAERAEYARLVAGEAATYAREKRYVRKDGVERWVEVAATAVRDPEGRFLRGVRVVQDVTARREAEERQRLLLAELSHRVKNTLAVVQSIANRSLAGDRTLQEAREALAKRLRALAGAHTLLTASEWRGASLRALAAAELGPYRGRAEARGADVTLGAKGAQSLALILHELATNAAKHGALSAPEGRVEVAWDVDGPTWRLTWREAGGPEVRPPARRGFGRLLVEEAAAHDLGGRARLEFRPEGLVYELEAPLAGLLAG